MKAKPMPRASAEPASRAALKLLTVKPVDKRYHALYQTQMLLFGSCAVCDRGRVHPIVVSSDGTSSVRQLCEECDPYTCRNCGFAHHESVGCDPKVVP